MIKNHKLFFSGSFSTEAKCRFKLFWKALLFLFFRFFIFLHYLLSKSVLEEVGWSGGWWWWWCACVCGRGGLHWDPSQHAGLGAPCRLRTFTRPPPALKTVHVSPPRRGARSPKISSSRLRLQFVRWNSYGRFFSPSLRKAALIASELKGGRPGGGNNACMTPSKRTSVQNGAPSQDVLCFFFREKDKTSSKRRDDWPRCWSGDPIMGRYNVKEGAVTMQPPCWAFGPNGNRCDFI